jgi:CMP-N-acetylneuraminic acid synthetase
MQVLAVIPARGGSRGVPGKNIRPLCGKPLLQYTIDCALAASRVSRVILSTDDERIAECGRLGGVDVPFLRPAELAQDDTPMLPVIQHAVRWLERRGDRYDAVCILQPTSPLRRAEEVDGCIALLATSAADAVVSIRPVPSTYNPHWVYFATREGLLQLSTGEPSPITRRQNLPAAFHRDGSVYVTRRDVLVEQNSLYGRRLAGHLVERPDHVNIDTPSDWDRCEQLIAAQLRRTVAGDRYARVEPGAAARSASGARERR